MKGAADHRQGIPVGGCSLPARELLAEARDFLVGLLQEDVEDLGVDIRPPDLRGQHGLVVVQAGRALDRRH